MQIRLEKSNLFFSLISISLSLQTSVVSAEEFLLADVSDFTRDEGVENDTPVDSSTYEDCEADVDNYVSEEENSGDNTMETDVKQFQCDICHKYFASSWNLKCHKNTHLGEFQKLICGVKFFSAIDDPRKQKFECRLCHSVYYSYKTLQKHKETHLGKVSNHVQSLIDSVKCIKTSSIFYVISDVPELGNSRRKKEFKCVICSKMLVNFSSLTSHMHRHLGEYIKIKEHHIQLTFV